MRRNPKELKHTTVSHWVGFLLPVYVHAYFKASQQKILFLELLFEIKKKKLLYKLEVSFDFHKITWCLDVFFFQRSSPTTVPMCVNG